MANYLVVSNMGPHSSLTASLHFSLVICVLAVIKCIYLSLTYLYFIQDIEDRCLLLASFTSFVDLPFQEHWITEKHHID
jgi:hypothetical protein